MAVGTRINALGAKYSSSTVSLTERLGVDRSSSVMDRLARQFAVEQALGARRGLDVAQETLRNIMLTTMYLGEGL